MQRKITGFHQDEYDDWVAELECCHCQHVRHKPPFFNRPWVTSQAGRNDMLGVELDCVRCDRLEWPAGLVAYKRTGEFTEQTIPEGLRKNHATKTGTWGQIHILAGILFYTVQQPVTRSIELNAGSVGIIAPGMLHSVTAKDKVRFYVEFFIRPVSTAGNQSN